MERSSVEAESEGGDDWQGSGATGCGDGASRRRWLMWGVHRRRPRARAKLLGGADGAAD